MSDAQLRHWLLRAAAAILAIMAFYAALRWLLPWLLPFLVAALAAAAMEPAVRCLQRRFHLRRGFCSLLLTLFLLFVLGGLFSLLGTALIGEAYALLAHFPALAEAVRAGFSSLTERLEDTQTALPPWLREWLAEQLARYAAQAGDLLNIVSNRLPEQLAALAAAVPRLLLGTATCVLAIYFTSSDLPVIKSLLGGKMEPKTAQKLRRFQANFARSAAHWLRAELTLCAVTFTELLVFFALTREPYAILLAFAVTLVDALPVFGTGTVLLPWAAAELLFGNTPKSIFLAGLYLTTLLVRNVLEPRLLSQRSGLPPVASLLAMYLGFCLLGVAGMVLFPFFLILLSQMNRQNYLENLC
ncbi:MAG: sporulation integral membrane protein YtvI [Ruminococcaceae bacterium]|nr:sporulation integral membrane protein YtvI [Oscillospiraceae bacterium]